MKTATSDSGAGLGMLVILLFAIGGGILSAWILDTVDLGMEISGVTEGVLVYYLTSMVISAGLLIAYKAPRSGSIFMAFYPFGLVALFWVGFNTAAVDQSEASNQVPDIVAAALAVAVQAYVWITPAVITGYYLCKVLRGPREPVCR